MFRKLMILSLTLLLAVSVTACKPNRPKGCPKLYPCTLKIIQGGEPLEGATVKIYADDPELAKWPIVGRTDANGQVVLMTQTYLGAPLGSYTVTVSKLEVPQVLPPVSIEHVEEQFTDKATSPLKLEVVKKMLEPVQFDVGDPQ
ncbi:MAG: hypothetical protein IKE69_08840 [Thermoguttaceae bacterium]|nr:hypothetical protein [Thermoguttaceae bacterium]